jgi:hypothetical protein
MMSPNKEGFYIRMLDWNLYSICNREDAGATLYVRTPKAKKFADDKPKEAGAYMCHDGDENGWYFMLFDGRNFIDNDGDIVKPKYFCEIILPTIEE